jgi:tetratricopeptide (TPR) repeat protein
MSSLEDFTWPRRFLLWLKPAGRALLDSLFQLTCFVLLAACLYLFVKEIMAKQPRYELLITLGMFTLVLALGCQYGQHFFARLKKIGPVELFEQEAPSLLQGLAKAVQDSKTTLDHLGAPLSPYTDYVLQRADLGISLLELVGRDQLKSVDKQIWTMMFGIGSVSLQRGEWWRARNRLELLREVAGEDFKAVAVSYNLGLAYWKCAEECPEQDKDKTLRLAQENFAKATDRDPFDHEAPYMLAYIQDELGLLDLAIQSNRKALLRRSDFAPARYNLAVSLLKKGEIKKAAEKVLEIREADMEGLETLQFAPSDPELWPLLKDADFGAEIRRRLEFFQNPLSFLD